MARLPLCRRAIAMLRTNGGDHPCVMLTDAFKRKGKGRASILWVPLTTSDKSRDPACVFLQGEGKLIMAGSWVLYAGAQIDKEHDLMAAISKRGRRINMVSQDAYNRIVEGLSRSAATSEPILDYFDEAVRQGKAG